MDNTSQLLLLLWADGLLKQQVANSHNGERDPHFLYLKDLFSLTLMELSAPHDLAGTLEVSLLDTTNVNTAFLLNDLESKT